MGIHRWYRSEGFVQFLLGNAWNDPDGRATGGRELLVISWVAILLSIFELVWILIYCGCCRLVWQ